MNRGPSDEDRMATKRGYRSAVKVHKESLDGFTFYPAVLGGFRRIRFLRSKAYSRRFKLKYIFCY